MSHERLDARPDPEVGAGGFREVDVSSCVSIHLVASNHFIDAGIGDAAASEAP